MKVPELDVRPPAEEEVLELLLRPRNDARDHLPEQVDRDLRFADAKPKRILLALHSPLSIIRKGQIIRSGLAKATAEIMSSSEIPYSMLTWCVADSARYRRCERELCAVQRKRIFIVTNTTTEGEPSVPEWVGWRRVRKHNKDMAFAGLTYRPSLCNRPPCSQKPWWMRSICCRRSSWHSCCCEVIRLPCHCRMRTSWRESSDPSNGMPW